MKNLGKIILLTLGLSLFSTSLMSFTNASAATVNNGAPKELKGTWITKVKKLSKTLRVKDSLYQRSIWYVGKNSTDESGLFYQTKTKPASMFNAESSGANKGLTYTKSGNTYYLNSKGDDNYFHYKAKLLNNRKIKLYFSSDKNVKKWHYNGEYYKQSTKLIHFTTNTKIKD
ncbi:hypothetical protein [Nicoliella spurrieriana]|nr:hypothetical protein [Nicoliella spurrieriana]